MATKTQISNRLTRLGVHFLFLGSFALFGGAVRGFNLLLVLAALLIGALLMQWRWTGRSIASVTATRQLPREAFTGTPFTVCLRLTNQSRLLATWMLRLEDPIERVCAPIFGNDRNRFRASFVGGVAVIRAGQTKSIDYDCVITQRGRFRFESIQLETTFPLYLFRGRKVIDMSNEICVLPKLLVLRQHWQRNLFGRDNGDATTSRRTVSSEGEFFGLREWQQGDSPKWIHWRTTARLNKPAVRQFEQQQRIDLCIVVDAYARSESDDDLAELAISLAATLVANMVASRSTRIVLGVAGRSRAVAVGDGSGPARHRMLVLLADAEACEQPQLAEALSQSIRMAGSSRDLVVVSSRSRAEAMMSTEGTMNLNPSMRPLSTVRWIDVRDNDLVGSMVSDST